MQTSKTVPSITSVLVILATCAAGCRPDTGVVRTGPHLPDEEAEPIRVQRPPPPVKVEAIPLRRNKDCSYVDGAWIAQDGDWVWKKGEWVLAPIGCYYARPVTRYEEFDIGTALVFRPGVWHSPSGLNCAEPVECPAPEGN